MPKPVQHDFLASGAQEAGGLARLFGNSIMTPQGINIDRAFLGYVTDYYPRSGYYEVRDGSTHDVYECHELLNGFTGLAMGARPVSGGILPKTPVLVWQFAGIKFIVATLPYATHDCKALYPDSLVCRALVGACDPTQPMLWEPLDRKTGTSYRDAGRPADALGGDWGGCNDMGLAMGIGKLMAFMRASDMAKIEAFYGDDLLRIFGHTLQTYTGHREEYDVADEGEGNHVFRYTPYSWEGVGSKEPLVEAVDEKSGHSKKRDAWWEPKKKKQMIIPRITRMSGYMGDLEHEWISVPGDDTPDFEDLDHKTKYIGVAEIHKGVDGSLLFKSAKEVCLEKTIFIPLPKELIQPDDPTGDNRKNYKAAGKLGEGGQTPELPEFEWNSDSLEQSAQGRATLLYDYHAWLYNRLTIGGLYLHTQEFDGKDWYLPPEEDLKTAMKADSALIQASLISQQNKFKADMPKHITLKVDHRRGAVKYYQSKSLIRLLDDGTVLIEDGYASSIRMSAGNIHISASGDIWNQTGRNFINWAGRDVIVRAGHSVDVTASLKDVHIKAEKDVEILAGNSGKDGALILDVRSVGVPKKTEFRDIGEDRKTRGILIKCDKAPIWMFSKDVYVGCGQKRGDTRVYIDGGAAGKVYIRGKDIINRMTGEFVVFDDGNKRSLLDLTQHQSHLNTLKNWFGGDTYMGTVDAPGNLMVGGRIECYQVGLFKGLVFSEASTFLGSRNLIAHMIDGKHKDPKFELPTPAKVKAEIEARLADVNSTVRAEEKRAVETPETSPGNDRFEDEVHFSLRKTSQYFGGQESTFFLWETRWQQAYRFGGGGVTWKEPEVKRPVGQAELPHPGRKAWQEDSKFRYMQTPKNHDGKTAIAKARKTLKEKAGDVKTEKLESQYKINVQEP